MKNRLEVIRDRIQKLQKKKLVDERNVSEFVHKFRNNITGERKEVFEKMWADPRVSRQKLSMFFLTCLKEDILAEIAAGVEDE